VNQQLPKTSFEGGRILRHLAIDPQSAAHPPTSVSPSLTYELYYGLKEKPFSLSADPRFLYQSPTHAPAYEELLNGIRRREGLIVVTGEIGTGKTTLIRSVLQNLDRRTFCAFVPDPFVSREDLLKMVLVDFGVVSITELKRGSLNGASRPDLTYPLYEFLDSLVPLHALAVLIVDEAQNLPLPLLEEIRILSDLEGREKLLQVVLVGQPELRANLTLPQMRQVDQRVSVRCEIQRLRLDDVAGYVRHRLNVAGDGDSRVEFSDGAIDMVHRGSGGTPRLINKICDRALVRGCNARINRIEAYAVIDAIGDLGLEMPSTSGSHLERESIAEPVPEITQVEGGAASIIDGASTGQEAAIEELSEFAAERELSAVREKAPLQRSRSMAGTFVMLAALAAGAMLVYFYSESRAGAVPLLTIPTSPARTRLLALAVPEPPAQSKPSVPFASRTAAIPGSDTGDRTIIQVAAFNNQADADALAERLARDGYRTKTITVDAGPQRGELVMVVIDGYPTADDAADDLARLREQFPDARIRQS
jgi:general secretion pathway protein A